MKNIVTMKFKSGVPDIRINAPTPELKEKLINSLEECLGKTGIVIITSDTGKEIYIDISDISRFEVE